MICRIFHKTMEKTNTLIYSEGQSRKINLLPHHHHHHQEIYNLPDGTNLITTPASSLFLPRRDLLIPAKDSAAPVPKQCCKAEADNHISSVVFPQLHHHQLLLPDLTSAGLHHHSNTNEILQNPNLLIFEMGSFQYGGMAPGADLHEIATYNSSCASSSAVGRALVGSPWPLLDP